MIILIRHGESQANMDQTLHQTLPDHEIALSSRGIKQAKEAGVRLYEYLLERYGGFMKNKLAFWNSPYRRTRETVNLLFDNFNSSLKLSGDPERFDISHHENILLCEQQFGLFDGLEDDEIKRRFPDEFKVWDLCKKYQGKFYARNAMGESGFDAAIRIKQSFLDIERVGADINVIVCHGNVIKFFIMMYFGKSPEWFASPDAATIGNCGFHVIEDNKDLGWYFPGYKKGELVKQHD